GAVQGQGGREVPEQALHRAGGHFPDAEKAQDVVDAQHVEVARQVAQALLPPGVVVFCHALPIVGREAPVLAGGGEVVGRGAGLLVE
nr:hypothetical protein [Tanacetum cinerariifolium]